MKKFLCAVLVAVGAAVHPRALKKAVAGVALAAGVVGMGASPVLADSAFISGDVIRHLVVNYTTDRTISVGGSDIWHQKTDGPEIDLRWRKCDGSVVGNWTRFADADPTGWKTIGTDFLSGTVFCLSSYSHGTNGSDTFSGNLEWNV